MLLALAAAVAAGEETPASKAPPAAEVTREQAVRTAVAWLVENQNDDGSWGKFTSGRTWEVRAHVPGGLHAFRAASTALCWLGLNDVEHQPEASKKAQARALKWLAAHARVKRAHGGELYNTWALAYGLRALSQALRKKAPGAPREDVLKTAEEIAAALERYQTPDGGWGYYDFRTRTYRPTWSTSFTTATAAVALREAETAGIAVRPLVFERARANILRCRKPDGTYLYGTYMQWRPMHGVNQPQGSSLRTQACNLALRRTAGALPDGKLREGLEQLVDHHRFALAGVRRPIPHESHYAVSGYFYLYGLQYGALALDRLDGKDRRRFARRIVSFVLKARQPDGSFWDYPLYGFHKPYGTGYALIALSRCRDVP